MITQQQEVLHLMHSQEIMQFYTVLLVLEYLLLQQLEQVTFVFCQTVEEQIFLVGLLVQVEEVEETGL